MRKDPLLLMEYTLEIALAMAAPAAAEHTEPQNLQSRWWIRFLAGDRDFWSLTLSGFLQSDFLVPRHPKCIFIFGIFYLTQLQTCKT